MQSAKDDFNRILKENEELKAEIMLLREEIKVLNFDKIALQETLDGSYIEHINLENAKNDNSIDWKSILEELPMGVFINGPQGVMWVNKAVESILGYSKEEYIKFDNDKIKEIVKFDLSINSLYHIADYFSSNPDGKYQIMEYQMKKKDGNFVWILSVHFPFIFKDGICIANIGCAIDISSRKKIESELIEANTNLEISQQREKSLMLKNQQMIQRQVELLKSELTQISVKHLELAEFTNDIIMLSKELENSLDGNAKQTLIKIKSKYTDKFRRDNLHNKFEEMFTKTDPQFYKTILLKHPDISHTELKICSLIKLHLDTNEIANILSLSKRTIEYHIYNIRKKIGLQRHERLEKYLIGI